MPRLFIAGIALFLLLGAGYGILQAARATPWDCADWQPFAHEDRTTAILETLAENRGKTLYCGIDQSDAFAKAETWAAGKDRNERDDTVYWGERGSFRGFIAAQEGWLTDGESGITGQSIATIFEFPRSAKRTKRTKRFTVGTDPEQFPINQATSCGQTLGLICATPERYLGGAVNRINAAPTGRRWGRAAAVGAGQGLGFGTGAQWYQIDPLTNDRWIINAQGQRTSNTPASAAWPSTAQWNTWAAAAAEGACRARGARYIANSAAIGPGHSDYQTEGVLADYRGPGLGFFNREVSAGGNNATYPTRQSRTWEARCKKTVRRNN